MNAKKKLGNSYKRYDFKAKESKKEERGDSGLYSEGSSIQNTSDFVYASNVHVENKHFHESNRSFEDTYEEFVSNLPLPVAELNTVRLNLSLKNPNFNKTFE